MNELWEELEEKRNKFLNWIELNAQDEVLRAAINYFELEEKVREATLRMSELDLAAAKQIKFENESLNSVISTYNLDKCFNEEKANKWLCKALELVIMHKYTFDGLKFENGKVKHLKTQITR
jgi:hypothetical protein